MIRKLNKIIQDYLKPKRLALGKYLYDKKKNKTICDIGHVIEKQEIKSIVFLRYDGKIGDMVVNSFIFREIKKNYPNIKISVVATGEAKKIIGNNPNIDKIYDFSKNIFKMGMLSSEIAKEKYDLLIDFSEVLRVRPLVFINLCKARINMGLQKKNWNTFDISFDHPQNKERHIQDTYIEVLRILGVNVTDKSYDLSIDAPQEETIERYIKDSLEGKRYMIFNPYAASKHRSFNNEKIKEMLKVMLKTRKEEIVLICTRDRVENLNKVVNELNENRVHIASFTLLETIALIKKATLVVTPDTAIVHIASAFDRPMIGIYREDLSVDNNANEWGPNSKYAKIIYSKSTDAFGEKSDINNFEIEELNKMLREE